MPGVQDMQVQFGLDVNGDGTVERYVNPGTVIAASTPIATVQLWLLVVSRTKSKSASPTRIAPIPTPTPLRQLRCSTTIAAVC